MSDTPTNTSTEDENKLIAERRQKLAAIREKRTAFPNQFRRSDYADELQKQFVDAEKAALEELNHEVAVAGRIMRKRGPFLVMKDVSGEIQLYVDRKGLSDDSVAEIKTWDIGDIVGAKGPVHRSGKGDLYVNMNTAELLTKSLRPLPDKFHGLSDQEMRYRQRYVDLIMNEDTRRVFQIRSQAIEAIRQFMLTRSFMEVETPMMQVIPGGATARPFITHHNSLDQDMYLRIAPELYLKRLVVGGFERVFEINRNFRNEGLSTRHNPEFTMLEFYWAFADYHELMNLTEDMLREVAQATLGSTLVTYQEEQYDLSQSFERISVKDSILKYNPELKVQQLEERESAAAIAEELGIPLKPSYGLGKIQIEIFEKTVEHQLMQPTFITEYPAEVSPLARRNDDDPFITDRFEFFLAGREIANGFSELNDAEDQVARFKAQVAEMEAGDDEAMHFDADYVAALEYGLPPTAGEGIGIDRLVMFLSNSPSIRDVILFPHLRHSSGGNDGN